MGVMPDEQGGSRAGRRTAELSSTLTETIKFRARRNDKTYVAFLDCRKAFDSMYRPAMLVAANTAGVGGRFFATLANSYEGVTSAVTVDGATSASFECLNGLRQGGILSPIVWAIYLTPLLNELRARNLGVELSLDGGDSVNVNALAYVDDIALVAKDAHNLQLALDIASRLANELQLTWNAGKCKIVVFGSPPGSQEGPWTVGAGEAKLVDSCKYLGLIFHRTLGWSRISDPDGVDPVDGIDAQIPPEHQTLKGTLFTFPGEGEIYEIADIQNVNDPEHGWQQVAYFAKLAELEDPYNEDVEYRYMSCTEAIEYTRTAVNPWKEHFDSVASKGRSGLAMCRKYGAKSGALSGGVSMNLLNTFCVSRMTHDQIVYATETEHAPALENVYTLGVKRILGVAQGTHNHAARELAGTTSLEINRRKTLLMHAKHVHDMPENRLTKKVWDIAAEDTTQGPGFLQSIPRYARKLATEWGLNTDMDKSKGAFKKAAKKAAFSAETKKFTDRDASKLCYFGTYEPTGTPGMAPCLTERISRGLATGRDISIRHLLGTNELEMDLGRHRNVAREDRTCKCCRAAPEDALHCNLLCTAPGRQELVTELRDKLARLDGDRQEDGTLISQLACEELHHYLQDPQLTGPRKSEWYAHLIKVRKNRDTFITESPLHERRVRRTRPHPRSVLSPAQPSRASSRRPALRQVQDLGPEFDNQLALGRIR